MWPFKKQKKSENEIDVNKPVENPKLLAAFERHFKEPTEQSALNVAKEISNTIFLGLILTDEMKTTPVDASGKTTIEKGSKIKFLNCFDDKDNCFFPVFTDWKEVQAWTDQPVSAIIMPANEVFDFAAGDYSGVVINPGTLGWTLTRDNIAAIKEDFP